LKRFGTNKLADKIFIKQLVVPALIGKLPEERKTLQKLLIDLEMSVDARAAAKEDDLSKTVDYARVRRLVINYIAQTAYHLLETLADHLACYLHEQFDFDAIRLCITKRPFDMPDVMGVGVIIERQFVNATL